MHPANHIYPFSSILILSHPSSSILIHPHASTHMNCVRQPAAIFSFPLYFLFFFFFFFSDHLLTFVKSVECRKDKSHKYHTILQHHHPPLALISITHTHTPPPPPSLQQKMKFLKWIKKNFGSPSASPSNSKNNSSSDVTADPKPAAPPSAPSTSRSPADTKEEQSFTIAAPSAVVENSEIPSPAQILAEFNESGQDLLKHLHGVSDNLKAIHLCDTDLPVAKLDAKKQFETLSEREQLYGG
jgi:hypothetical protein